MMGSEGLLYAEEAQGGRQALCLTLAGGKLQYVTLYGAARGVTREVRSNT